MVQKNTCLPWDQASSKLQYLVWNRFNFHRIGFERSPSMIWLCDYHSSLGLRLLWHADGFPIRDWIHKSVVRMHWEKGHDIAYKMTITLKTKAILSCASFQLIAFVIGCQFVISYLWAMSVSCENHHMSVWWHIEIAKDKFEFEFPACCLFNVADMAWSIIFEICALFSQQESHNVRTVFAPILIVSHSYLMYSIRRNNMPRCFINHAHSLKAWTAFWMATICIGSMKEVFASISPHGVSSYQCL